LSSNGTLFNIWSDESIIMLLSTSLLFRSNAFEQNEYDGKEKKKNAKRQMHKQE
jgi:hypothetical protein